MARVAVTLGVLLVAALAAPPGLADPAASTASPWAVRQSATVKVADLVGAGSINDTGTRYGVAGTDLGHMFMVGDRMAMVFGDTFGGPPSTPFFSRGRATDDWRSNVMASIVPPDSPADGLTFAGMVSDRAGHAKELIASRKKVGDQETVIPTYGIDLPASGSTPAQMVLQYMSVRSFDTPGHWRLTGAGMATSTDGGTTWTDRPAAARPADTRFGQVAFVRPGGPDDPDAPVPDGSTAGETTYVYGIPGGRYGDASLARVPTAQLLDASAWRYWNGSDWVAGEQNAVPVVKGPVGELSVRWSSYYRTWLMAYLVDDTGEIVLRTAPAPTGPWSPAQVVTTTTQYPQAYAPYLTPRWNDGPDIWFTMSQYTTYRVELMRTRLDPIATGDPVPAADVPRSAGAGQASLTAPPADPTPTPTPQ